VELRSESDAVVLRVLDDGVGLDGGPASDSFGIVGMRERAVLLGGSLELVDRDPRGLEVRVRIPTSET
jgi:signal transduction histidine kinase